MERLRIGILGCGRISERHAVAIAADPERLELVGCASRTLERAQALAMKYGGRAYGSFQAMLDHARLDGLVVALPPFAHAGEVEAAASAGVHLLLEKPIALDNTRAQAMVAATEASGIITQVGFMQRFGDAVERWKELEQDGGTGRVGLMTGCFYVNAPHGPWWTQRSRSGGQIVEQLIHIVDLVRHLMGEPDSVYARTANLFHRGLPDYDVDDLTTIVLGFDDGRSAVLTASDAVANPFKMKEWRVLAEHRSAFFDNENSARIAAIEASAEQVETIASQVDPFRKLMQDFADAILDGHPARIPITEGARSLALALAARAAGDERNEIRLSHRIGGRSR